MAVQNRLKEILDERGIKQNWLAKKVGVTKANISNIVLNRQQTSIDTAFKIADILNMKLEEVFIYTRDKE